MQDTRYVLTDIGGVRIEKGLDLGRPGETTDVSLLDDELWRCRWTELQAGAGTFQELDHVTITGTGPSA